MRMNEPLGGGKSFTWYPTDPMSDSLESIQCYINENSLSKIVEPPMFLTLDESGIQEASTKESVAADLDLVICVNMIHISPWEATLGLMKVASESLSPSGCLYCYGPYKVGGTAVESNLYVQCGSFSFRNRPISLLDIHCAHNFYSLTIQKL